jgi:hypothetical protein
MRPAISAFSRHRAVTAWAALLVALAFLMVLEVLRHGVPAGTAFPNRADSESEATGQAAQGAGVGDVAPLGDHH